MSDEVSALREEVAVLRDELGALRKSHHELLERLMEMPSDPSERWPRYFNLQADYVAVRSDQKQIPLVIRADENGAAIAFMDENHRTRLELSIGKEGGRIELHNAEGNLVFQVAEGKDGSGQVCVCDPEGHSRAGMRVNEFGGLISIVDTAGKAQALMIGTNAGGEMHVVNVMHKGSVAIKAPPTGGEVCVNEPSGQLMAFLSASTETGCVSVHGPHGELAAGLIGSEHGGAALFHDLDGKVIFRWPE